MHACVAKLAVIAGMRPGEIAALTWGRLTATYADIRQRVYRGAIDTPKTDQSVRKAALSEGLLRDIEVWREFAVEARDDAWVFPSDRMTVLSKDNCWRRSMQPKLEKGFGLGEFSGPAPDPCNLAAEPRGGREAGRRSARP
jgi:integrase